MRIILALISCFVITVSAQAQFLTDEEIKRLERDTPIPERHDGSEHQYVTVYTSGKVIRYITGSDGSPGVVIHIGKDQPFAPADAKPEDFPIGSHVLVKMVLRNATYDKGNPYVLDTFELTDIEIIEQ